MGYHQNREAITREIAGDELGLVAGGDNFTTNLVEMAATDRSSLLVPKFPVALHCAPDDAALGYLSLLDFARAGIPAGGGGLVAHVRRRSPGLRSLLPAGADL